MSEYIVRLGFTKVVEAESEEEAEQIAIDGIGFGFCGYEWDEQDASSVEEIE